MAKLAPKFVFSIIFFDNSPSISWSLKLCKGKKTLQTLADGKLSYDQDVVRLAKQWEEAGAEVIAIRYREGEWSEQKPWKWFNRFKRLL